jgi:hypothetical protein
VGPHYSAMFNPAGHEWGGVYLLCLERRRGGTSRRD